MKRRLLIGVFAAALALGAAAPAFSQAGGQTDVTLHVPYRFGIVAEGTDYSTLAQYTFLIPELRMSYYFGNEFFRIGPGVRLLTLIIESMAYPLVSAEMDFDPFVVNANVGGYGFLFFGLINDFQSGNVVIPELSVAYKLNDTIRLGTGAILFMAPEASADVKDFAYIGTVFVRFSF